MDPRLRVIADNDQDAAECRAWWRETSVEDKLRVWDAIQRDHSDPVAEVVSRFAQLAFGRMAAEEAGPFREE